ncbi:MAG: FAD-binding oxidoreductase [Candidatus Omnitrophota bacterium]
MIVKTDIDTMRPYLEDSSNLQGGYAEKVVIPGDAGEVAEAVREAASKKTPLYITGGGTGTTGGRIPFGGTVVSMERLNGIMDISGGAMAGTVQAGVLVEEFKAAAEKNGLFYPCHPTERTAFVGGTIATNASGARSFKYGPTRKHVKRLKMVMADGSMLELRRGEKFLSGKMPGMMTASGALLRLPFPSYRMPDVKNSAGYYARDGMDLIDLFIGQEGTLSVITEAEMGLAEKPRGIFGCFVFFTAPRDAWGFASELKTMSQRRMAGRKTETLDVLSVEYFDTNAVGMLRSGNKNVPGKARAAIFFEEELPGGRDDARFGIVERLISRHRSSLDDTWVAMNEKELDDFTAFRYAIPETINDIVRRSGFRKLSTDIAVPDKGSYEMMRFYTDLLRDTRIEHVIFGHIGENHVHVNLLPRSEDEARRSQELCLKFVRKGVALGGTVSAEHGIGKTRHRYLEEMYGKEGVREMARLKKALDPDGILSPGNIFAAEELSRV